MKYGITAQQARAIHTTTQRARYRHRAALQSAKALLAAPIPIGTIQPDNLVPAALIAEGMEVQIPQWGRVLPGDTLTVMWDDTDTLTTFVVTNPASTFPFYMTVAPDKMAEDGAHPLNYHVTTTTGATSQSETTIVTVDHRAPNNNQPPLAFVFPPEVVSGGVTLEYLEANSDQVKVTVPHYAGMEAGQLVTSSWSGFVLPTVTVTASDVANACVMVTVPGDVIRQAGEGTANALYRLTSRAGFVGPLSDNSAVSVWLSPVPTNLKAPRVPLAADGVIDLPDADLGVTIEVAAYTNFLTGDSIIATWGDTTLNEVQINSADEFPVSVRVVRSVVLDTGSGTVEVAYKIRRLTRYIPSSTITVTTDVGRIGPADPDPDTNVNEALTGPTVKGASGNVNKLVITDANKPATVTVPFYLTAATGDVIDLYWGPTSQATHVGTTVLSAQDVANSTIPDMTVSAAIVDTTPDSSGWPVYYTLSNPATSTHPNPVFSEATLVSVKLTKPGGPTGLQPAVFPDINSQGWLLTETVINGANVNVLIYPNMALGDVVKLTWQAYSSTNAATGSEITSALWVSTDVKVSAAELLNGIAFVVPYKDAIEPIATDAQYSMGSGTAVYTVMQDGNDYLSPPAVVPIDLGQP
ncbi:MAG TPA: hypothetical protein VL424_08745 [Pararobbsia sp.]|nr:hypothetical protein [Pararobbsia sp.]